MWAEVVDSDVWESGDLAVECRHCGSKCVWCESSWSGLRGLISAVEVKFKVQGNNQVRKRKRKVRERACRERAHVT
jgi:hypothetical protein